MTAPRDVDRLLRTYLDTGPTELPDRSFDVVREVIERTQQRVVIGPWRNPMSGLARFATAAAAVAVLAVVVGINLLPAGGIGGPAATPTPTAAPTPSPTPTAVKLPEYGALHAGRYLFQGEWTPQAFTVDVSAGWSAMEGSFVLKDNQQPTTVFLAPWIIDHIYPDPCDQSGAATPLGPTVDDLVTALMAMDARQPVGPTDTTIGGYPAKLVRLSLPLDTARTGCTHADGIRNWPDPGGEGGFFSKLGETDDLYVVDVDGQRLVLVVAHGVDASAADIAELGDLVGSVAFVQP
jgi:hypothetical protein